MARFDSTVFRKTVRDEIGSAGRDAERLQSTLRRVTDQAERILAESQEADTSLIACRAGCKSCCVVNVSVLFPEGLAISDYLQSLLPMKQARITERLDELWRAVRGLTDEERISLRQSCAFLDDAGHCCIYPVRPLLCRSITSTSAESCRQALTDHFFDEESPVLMNLFQQQLFENVYLGVAEGLEGTGLDGRGIKLTGLVRYLTKKPEAGTALLSGERLTWQDLA